MKKLISRLQPKKTIQSPITWVVILLIVFHGFLSSEQKSIIPELENQKFLFQSYWDTQKKHDLAKQGIVPNQEQQICSKKEFLTPFINKTLLYKVVLCPHWFYPTSLLLSWMVQPSWLYLLFIIIMGFIFYGKLRKSPINKNWLYATPFASLFLASSLYALLTINFDLFPQQLYMGLGPALAALAGMFFSLHPQTFIVEIKDIPIKISYKTAVAIFLFIDLIINVLANPTNFVLIFILNALTFTTVFWLSHKFLEETVQSTPNTSKVKNLSIQEHFDDAWRLVGLLELEAAAQAFKTAINKVIFKNKSDLSMLNVHFKSIKKEKVIMPFEWKDLYQWAEK